jgi:DNA repair ATPase RecN
MQVDTCLIPLGRLFLRSDAQEVSIEIEEALDKNEKLEQMIESEKKRSKKSESRIKKLISLKDKYRKRTNYLELQLNENNLTEPQLLRKAKRFGRLHREYLKRNREKLTQERYLICSNLAIVSFQLNLTW